MRQIKHLEHSYVHKQVPKAGDNVVIAALVDKFSKTCLNTTQFKGTFTHLILLEVLSHL